MEAIINIMRLRAWKFPLFTVNIHVCYLSIFYLLLITNFSRNIWDVLLLLIAVSLYISYGSLINDYFDMPYDKLTEKKKHIYRLKEWQIIGLLVLITFINFSLVLFVINDVVFTFIFLIAYFLATFYSAPPLRFKNRGLIGVICDSIIEKPLPVLLIFCFFTHFEIDTLLFVLLVGIIQFYTIVKHQIDDYENDILTKTNTFVINIGKEKAEKNLNTYFYPLNAISIILFYMIVLIRIPSINMFLSLIVLNVLGYLVSRALRLEEVKSFIGTFPERSREMTYLNVSFHSILIFVLALKCTIESFQYIPLLLLFITSQYYLIKTYFYLFKNKILARSIHDSRY
jgi:4-hydroxybenzoate polyprenyltransferase